MALVKRSNTELTVPEEKVAEYLSMGYSLLDSDGNVVKAPTKEDVATLKAEKAKLEAELEKTQAELKKAKAEITKLKKEK